MAFIILIVLKRQTLEMEMSNENTATVEESGFILRIPAELVDLSVRFGNEGMGRAVSALYNDVENLFPGGFPTEEDR